MPQQNFGYYLANFPKIGTAPDFNDLPQYDNVNERILDYNA
jgi:hypothetical protein